MSTEQRKATPGVHQITVGLSGFPDVPNQYGNGVLRSDSVDLLYFPNGVVAARLYGVWVPEDGAEPDGRIRNNYKAPSKDDAGDWPDWLAELVRENEPLRIVALAGILREAADRIDAEDLPQTAEDTADFCDGARWATEQLRRIADEADAEPAGDATPDWLMDLARGGAER